MVQHPAKRSGCSTGVNRERHRRLVLAGPVAPYRGVGVIRGGVGLQWPRLECFLFVIHLVVDVSIALVGHVLYHDSATQHGGC
jgi:hypothetical protein